MVSVTNSNGGGSSNRANHEAGVMAAAGVAGYCVMTDSKRLAWLAISGISSAMA